MPLNLSEGFFRQVSICFTSHLNKPCNFMMPKSLYWLHWEKLPKKHRGYIWYFCDAT